MTPAQKVLVVGGKDGERQKLARTIARAQGVAERTTEIAVPSKLVSFLGNKAVDAGRWVRDGDYLPHRQLSRLIKKVDAVIVIPVLPEDYVDTAIDYIPLGYIRDFVRRNRTANDAQELAARHHKECVILDAHTPDSWALDLDLPEGA